MKTIYATQFNIIPEKPIDINPFLDLCKSWIIDHYQYNPTPVIFPSPNIRAKISPRDMVEYKVVNINEHRQYHNILWIHPDGKSQSLQWLVEIKFAFDDVIEFGCAVKLYSQEFIVQPYYYLFGRPRIVPNIISRYPCKRGSESLYTYPVVLTVENINSCVDFIRDDTRKTAVVIISKEVRNNEPVIDPNKLADILAGLAHVYVLSDKWVSFKLTELLGKPYSCFNGAIRLYWAGFKIDSDPFDHPLWLADSISTHASQQIQDYGKYILHKISSVASLRYVNGELLSSILTEANMLRRKESERRKKELDSLKTLASNQELTNNQYTELFDGLAKENDLLKEEVDNCKYRIEELEQQLQTAQDNIQDIQKYKQGRTQDDVSPSASTSIDDNDATTVLEAVEHAIADYSETLIFLPKTKKTAKESPFANPQRVYEALKAIHEVCLERRSGSLNKSLIQAYKEKCFSYKNKISVTTKGTDGDEYYGVYKGKKILFEEHITEGAGDANTCFSIHMNSEVEKNKVVISDVGRHKSNQSS